MTDARDLHALPQQLRNRADKCDGYAEHEANHKAQAFYGKASGLREAADELNAALAALAGQLAPLVQLLNGWQEIGEEMSRVISSLTQEEYEGAFPDWFGSRLFDLQVKAKQQADTLAAVQRSLETHETPAPGAKE